MDNQSLVMQPKPTFRKQLVAGAKAFGISLGCGTVAGAAIPVLHFANFSTDAIWFGAGVGALLTFPPALYAFQCQWNAATRNEQDRDFGNSIFSPAGIEAANNWLDSMMLQPATPEMADNKPSTTTAT